uniref:17-beta-hydroxysteroid dehydrogenase type 6 n=1 Tax=Parascaris univalens TaxID=6257 RepID=A0A915AA73_PARUN
MEVFRQSVCIHKHSRATNIKASIYQSKRPVDMYVHHHLEAFQKLNDFGIRGSLQSNLLEALHGEKRLDASTVPARNGHRGASNRSSDA